MLKFLSFLSGLGGLGAALFAVYTLYGSMSGQFNGESGMAILVFLMFAAVGIFVALVFGFIAYFIARSKGVGLPVFGKLGLWLGGASGTALLLAMAMD